MGGLIMEVRDRRLTTEDVATAADKRHEERAEDEVIRRDNRRKTRVNGGSTHEEDQELSALFSEQEEKDFRSRWTGIQSSFVDEPRRAVEQADELVAQTMQRLAQSFSEQKKKLETHWEESEQISTEELRMALRHYRSFFDRLLSV